MPLVIPLFWCELGGTMSFAHDVKLPAKGPALDLSDATAARFRLRAEDGTVSHLAATIDAGATATTCTVRHALDVGSFDATGSWSCLAELSFDAGSTWYACTADTLTVEDTQ